MAETRWIHLVKKLLSEYLDSNTEVKGDFEWEFELEGSSYEALVYSVTRYPEVIHHKDGSLAEPYRRVNNCRYYVDGIFIDVCDGFMLENVIEISNFKIK